MPFYTKCSRTSQFVSLSLDDASRDCSALLSNVVCALVSCGLCDRAVLGCGAQQTRVRGYLLLRRVASAYSPDRRIASPRTCFSEMAGNRDAFGALGMDGAVKIGLLCCALPRCFAATCTCVCRNLSDDGAFTFAGV